MSARFSTDFAHPGNDWEWRVTDCLGPRTNAAEKMPAAGVSFSRVERYVEARHEGKRRLNSSVLEMPQHDLKSKKKTAGGLGLVTEAGRKGGEA
jgi:hypothetical protein